VNLVRNDGQGRKSNAYEGNEILKHSHIVYPLHLLTAGTIEVLTIDPWPWVDVPGFKLMVDSLSFALS